MRKLTLTSTRFSGRMLLTGAAVLLTGLAAHAATISIGLNTTNNGATATTVASGTGAAVYSGTFGAFDINTITAQGPPALPAGTLETTSINTSTTSAGTLYVFITASGLTSPTGLTEFLSSMTAQKFTGNVTSVTESTFYSPTNALYGGTLLTTHNFTNIDTYTATSTPYNLSGTFSETAEYAITLGPGGGSANDTINLSTTSPVPEPSSFVLLGSGLLGVAGVLKRRLAL